MQFLVLALNFILVWTISPQLSIHKFYVSTTEIELKKESKTLQITAKLFIDDLELLLQQTDKSLRLDKDSNVKLIDSLLKNELKKGFKISTKNNFLEYTFLGKEYKNDITFCYLELKLENIPELLNIQNTLFFNIFEKQQNIIHFKSSRIRESFLLHSNKHSVTIELKK